MLDPKNLKNGESQHEEYYSNTCKRNLIQYDYRHTNGELFSTVKRTLKDCVVARNKWIDLKEKQQEQQIKPQEQEME